jgi:two-component system, NarL family, nitrate/nitrite response regulator NarL
MATSPEPPKSTKGMPVRTLIVDDSESALTAICIAAASDGVEIIGTANNGCEALEKVRRWQPKLVVMDVQMPPMNGIAAAKQLKSEFPDTLVILLSLHDSQELRSLCRKCGAYAFVRKAFLARELPAAIEAALTNPNLNYVPRNTGESAATESLARP